MRDALYSQPPGNLPDTPADAPRHGVVQGQRTLARPGRRRRAQRARRARPRRRHDRDPHHRPRTRVPGREGDADRPRARACCCILRGPGGFHGGRVVRRAGLARSTSTRRSASWSASSARTVPAGRSLMPLLRKEVDRGPRRDLFAEMTFHAAYEPQRAIRTRRWKYIRRFDGRRTPVLREHRRRPQQGPAGRHGLGRPAGPEEAAATTSMFDPKRRTTWSATPSRADVLAGHARRGSRAGWRRRDDPLRHGPVEPPPGAYVNSADEMSASTEPSGALR